MKKIFLTGLVVTTMLATVGFGSGIGFQVGEKIYSDNFEVVRVISKRYKILEVRDRETGVHYINGYNDDTFSPYYNKNGKIKITEINNKYKEKEI